MDENKPVCYIGKMMDDNCGTFSTRGKILKSCIFGECTEDIQTHLSTVVTGLSTAIKDCTNANEKWLILNRLKVDNINDSEILCGKHRSKYGIGYKGPNTCCYPKHEDTKSKLKKKDYFRVITAKHLTEINELFTSLANTVKLPLGSMWCNACRLRVHPNAMKEVVQEVNNKCLICCENHVDVFQTPKKRRCVRSLRSTPDVIGTPCSTSSFDSQDDFTPDIVMKDSFNKSMGNISYSWTPIKYQVRKDFFMLNKKTQEKLIRKGTQAVYAVLEKIAPGQGDILKQEIFKNYVKIDITEDLKEAVASSLDNVKIQLLSIVAGKNDGNYTYTIEQLSSIFPGTSKHYIEQARKHAAGGKIGMPIEPGKYCRKKLTDHQIDHFLDFIQHGGLMQDVASGTRQVTLSSKRKAIMPNVIRTVHKAEIIPLI